MATTFADDYEAITGKKREDFDNEVGPVTVTEAVEPVVEVSEPETKDITPDSDDVKTA